MYDVYASILFAQMADVIAETPKGQRPEWPTALKQLRVHAFLGANQYVHLDERCDGHEEEFLEILAEAVRRLAACGRITAKEAAAWIVCGRQPIIWRGEGFEETAPVIAFAESLDAIVRGEYPEQPAGYCWFFGGCGVSVIGWVHRGGDLGNVGAVRQFDRAARIDELD